MKTETTEKPSGSDKVNALVRDCADYVGSHCWKSTEYGCKTVDQLINKKRFAQMAVKTWQNHDDEYSRENLDFFSAALNHINERIDMLSNR